MLGMFEKNRHVISYLWSQSWIALGVWHDVDPISDYLYLSCLPMRGDEENLIKKVHGVDQHEMLVVSVLESFENTQSRLLMDPVRPYEWKKTFNVDQTEVKVDHAQVSMKDFGDGDDVDIKSAAEIVMKIQEYREKKQSVLVHCKAGRTRSAMLVACVLALYDSDKLSKDPNKSTRELIDLAVDFAKVQRDQVKVFEKNRETAVKIVNMVKSMSLGNAAPDEPLKVKVQRLAGNKILKEFIMDMPSYKKLIQYRDSAIQNSGQLLTTLRTVKRVEHINKIIKSISDVNDTTWLDELIGEKGSIKELLDAKPKYFVVPNGDTVKDQVEREDIIKTFRREIVNLFTLNLNCTKQELEILFEPKRALMQSS